MEGNWLEDAPDATDAWLEDTEDDSLTAVPKGTSIIPRPLLAELIPQDPAERERVIAEAWGKLSPRQQGVLYALRRNSFNVRATVRALADTSDKVAFNTIQAWKHQQAFAFVFKLMQMIERNEVIDPDRLLLQADHIYQQAIEPQVVLDRDGKVVGHTQGDLGNALRANEQLMKATGMLKGDDKSARVTVRFVNLAGAEDAQAIEGEAQVIDD